MAQVNYKGFGGVALSADVSGNPEDPTVLLLHGGCEDHSVWSRTAKALVKAGRHVINLDMRGHGQSGRPLDGRYDFEAFVEDLSCVLSQIESRPVIVAAPLGGWVAAATLARSSVPLATGLILADPPTEYDPVSGQEVADKLKEVAEQDQTIAWDPAFVEKFDAEQAIAQQQAAGPNLKIPILLVRGAKSEHTTTQTAERFVSGLADAEFAEISGAGHHLATDPSEQFNAAVLDFLERKNPRYPQHYESGSDSRLLRDAMGCFATGVCVVTAINQEGQPIGLTVNSFTSVSLDPPLVLFCVANGSRNLKQLEMAKHFAVNILHIGQQPTSNVFARPGEDRFSAVEWEKSESGVPILTNALGNIECSQHAMHEAGDHAIFVGHVDRVNFDARKDPLLYYGGKYRRLHLL